MKRNPALFEFDKNVEKEYKESYFKDSIRQIRVSFLLLIVLYSLFSLVDYLFSPENFHKFLIIRFVFVIPICLSAYLFTYFNIYHRIWQGMLVLSFIVSGSGIASMLIILENDPMYVMGMMLVLTAGFTLVRLRFKWATIAGWLTLVIYNALILTFTTESIKNLVIINAFLISSIIIGMIISYFQESEVKNNFILRRELQEKSTLIESINDILGERVETKTVELFERNKELLQEIEHRKEIERELIEAKEKAESANKQKSTFLANISHEIRTPLNAIIGFSEILSSEMTNPEYMQFAQSIRQSGNSLLTIINDILDYSYMESGRFRIKKSPEKIQDLFAEIQTIFWQSAEKKGLELKINCKDEMPSVMIDTAHFRQVLINLIGNALKFTDEGQVLLELVCKGSPKPGYCGFNITVSDTGIGIPPDELEKIFYAFEQGKNNKYLSEQGTGLGLSISKRIVEELGGTIRVESEVGKGTSFIVELPEVEIASPSEEPPVQNENNPVHWDFERRAVLIVDDIAINRKVLTKQLEKMNLDVTAACSGEEALKLVLTKAFDLFIFDLRMPTMDGEELAQNIKAIHDFSNRPIICITASMNPEEKYRLKDFDAVLFKPSSYKQIAEVIMNVFEKKEK
jgi:signal transduction histidine kinase/CheY-like chemotaxis protein